MNVALKGGQKAHGLKFEATVTGLENCVQFIAFTSLLCIVCVCQIQLDEIQCLIRSRQSKSLLPLKQRALAQRHEHRLSDSKGY